MNEPTLTDTERVSLSDAAAHTFDSSCWNLTCEGSLPWIVARIKAEAVDRERAAWATKVTALAATWDSIHDQIAPSLGEPPQGQVQAFARDLRGLLSADDTEAKA